jgi:hypothetical protein
MKCMVPTCKRTNPTDGHYRAHESKGELVRRTMLNGGRIELIWALPDRISVMRRV